MHDDTSLLIGAHHHGWSSFILNPSLIAGQPLLMDWFTSHGFVRTESIVCSKRTFLRVSQVVSTWFISRRLDLLWILLYYYKSTLQYIINLVQCYSSCPGLTHLDLDAFSNLNHTKHVSLISCRVRIPSLSCFSIICTIKSCLGGAMPCFSDLIRCTSLQYSAKWECWWYVK
jgi:hypothetical protein